jgi:hypothetical protein
MNLFEIAGQYQQAFVALCDSDFDDETIDDTLEGLEGEVIDKGRNVAAFFLNLDVEIEAVKLAEKRISNRRKMLENKQTRLKDYLAMNMAKCGITEIRALDSSFVAKLQIGRDQAVVIDDVAAIPPDYMREVPATFAPAKADILKALKEGFEVPGAHIEKRNRLVIS